MTKLITIFIIVLAVFAGWKLFNYYQQVEAESKQEQKAAIGADIRPENLPGLPWGLESSLQVAQKNGATTFRNWLNAYGASIQDPRKAWIEMDYCLSAARDNPNDAKRVFKAIKERTSTNSPVYPRLRQLEKTFE